MILEEEKKKKNTPQHLWRHMHKAHVPLRLAVYQWLRHLQLDDVSGKAKKQGERKKKRTFKNRVQTRIGTVCCAHMHHSALFATPWTDVLKSADLQCAQEEAFVRMFTVICCEQFRRAGGRSLALWDKRPFVFNQSPSSNEGKNVPND